MLREHPFDPSTERRLFSLAIPSADALPRLALPPGNFACLLAWDARDESAETISGIVASLLRQGASYFVCWGPDCERVHDIIDEMASRPESDFGVPEEACIVTTWHASEPLSETLWFFLVASRPDGHYQQSTHAALAIAVGSPSWAAEIGEALDHPRPPQRSREPSDGGEDMPATSLSYLDQDCTASLAEGIAEYYAHNAALLDPSNLPLDAAELFCQHDAGHVVFGCDTSLRGETLIDTWTLFGTTAGLRGYLEYFRYPQVNQIFANAGYWRIALEVVRSLPDVFRVLVRSRQLSAKWPWRDYERHLARSLSEIRREFNIRVVEDRTRR